MYGQHSFDFWGAAIQALLASPYVRYSPEGYLRDRYFEALMWGDGNGEGRQLHVPSARALICAEKR